MLTGLPTRPMVSAVGTEIDWERFDASRGVRAPARQAARRLA